ncbi:MAG: hypothetical protein ABIQ95_04715 [Bdellovibrionia bacterium]
MHKNQTLFLLIFQVFSALLLHSPATFADTKPLTFESPSGNEVFIPSDASEDQFGIREFKIEELKSIDDGFIPEGYPYPTHRNSYNSNSLSLIVILENIMNIGKGLWTLIEQNRPTSDIKQDTAFALPSGVPQWEDLEAWATPVSKVYHITYSGFFGQKAVDFYYRLLFLPRGTYEGKGLYLSNVTIMPANLYVGWGYHFSSNVLVSKVFNAGSHSDPIGAMQLQIEWQVDALFSHRRGSHEFYIRGDGTFQDLSNGNQEIPVTPPQI